MTKVLLEDTFQKLDEHEEFLGNYFSPQRGPSPHKRHRYADAMRDNIFGYHTLDPTKAVPEAGYHDMEIPIPGHGSVTVRHGFFTSPFMEEEKKAELNLQTGAVPFSFKGQGKSTDLKRVEHRIAKEKAAQSPPPQRPVTQIVVSPADDESDGGLSDASGSGGASNIPRTDSRTEGTPELLSRGESRGESRSLTGSGRDVDRSRASVQSNHSGLSTSEHPSRSDLGVKSRGSDVVTPSSGHHPSRPQPPSPPVGSPEWFEEMERKHKPEEMRVFEETLIKSHTVEKKNWLVSPEKWRVMLSNIKVVKRMKRLSVSNPQVSALDASNANLSESAEMGNTSSNPQDMGSMWQSRVLRCMEAAGNAINNGMDEQIERRSRNLRTTLVQRRIEARSRAVTPDGLNEHPLFPNSPAPTSTSPTPSNTLRPAQVGARKGSVVGDNLGELRSPTRTVAQQSRVRRASLQVAGAAEQAIERAMSIRESDAKAALMKANAAAEKATLAGVGKQKADPMEELRIAQAAADYKARCEEAGLSLQLFSPYLLPPDYTPGRTPLMTVSQALSEEIGGVHATQKEFYDCTVVIHSTVELDRWRFSVTITDMTDTAFEKVGFTDLKVDERNEILFPLPTAASRPISDDDELPSPRRRKKVERPVSSTLYTVDTCHWVNGHAFDLYQHRLKITVEAESPIRRYIGDILVHFGRDSSEAASGGQRLVHKFTRELAPLQRSPSMRRNASLRSKNLGGISSDLVATAAAGGKVAPLARASSMANGLTMTGRLNRVDSLTLMSGGGPRRSGSMERMSPDGPRKSSSYDKLSPTSTLSPGSQSPTMSRASSVIIGAPTNIVYSPGMAAQKGAGVPMTVARAPIAATAAAAQKKYKL